MGGEISEEFKNSPIESLEDMQARVFDFWKEKLPEFEGKNVLIVAHDGVARMSRMFFGESPENGNTKSLGVENASIYILKK